MDVGTHNIILGTDWLKAHNPELDWTTSRLQFSRCLPTCILSSPSMILTTTQSHKPAMYISSLEPCPPTPDFPLYAAYAAPYFALQHGLYKCLELTNVRTKTMHFTNLAANASKTTLLHHVPAQFSKYHTIFSESASQHLPKHQPWDHAIDLKPDLKFKSRHIYSLTPAETQSLQGYLMDHLRCGYIRPSKSPIASPFFFVGKKDGKLRPVQDYRDLNNITIKNATPLPLIPNLIDKLQGAQYFTKFDIC
jgi:hypothetical protein